MHSPLFASFPVIYELIKHLPLIDIHGIFSIVKQEGIKTPVSISTQANTTNLAAVNFWASLGASRVIMAREVRKEDLVEIMKNAQCEVETFIHGAICISMSGRCLISSYMTGKDCLSAY